MRPGESLWEREIEKGQGIPAERGKKENKARNQNCLDYIGKSLGVRGRQPKPGMESSGFGAGHARYGLTMLRELGGLVCFDM